MVENPEQVFMFNMIQQSLKFSLWIFVIYLEISLGLVYAGHPVDQALPAKEGGIKVEWIPLGKKKLVAGEKGSFALKFTKKGQPLELEMFHKRTIHLMVVHEYFKNLGHIHPEDFRDKFSMEDMKKKNEYYFEYTFPRPGKYFLVIDIKTKTGFFYEVQEVSIEGLVKDHSTFTDYSDLQGAIMVPLERDERYVDAIEFPNPDQLKLSNLKIKCDYQDHPIVGEEHLFEFTFQRNNLPLRTLKNYLEAPLHLLFVREDFKHVLHTHGATEKKSRQGSGSHRQDINEKSMGPKLYAKVNFPAMGEYRMFIQARVGDQLIVANFLIDVVERVREKNAQFPKPEFGQLDSYWITKKPIRASQLLEPTQKHEISFLLQKGHLIRVHYLASEGIYYDLHYHPGGNKSRTKHLYSPIQSSFKHHEYRVQEDRKIWVMWENKGEQKVQLQYEIHIGTF